MARSVFYAILVVALLAISPAAAQTGARPTIAVYITATKSVVGEALADAITQKLVETGQYTVIDRGHIRQILQEQGFAASGQVLPTSEAQLGRMFGANYIITGKISSFNATVGNSGMTTVGERAFSSVLQEKPQPLRRQA